MDMLMQSRQLQQPLSGAMFWNAAVNVSQDFDGYNIYVDR